MSAGKDEADNAAGAALGSEQFGAGVVGVDAIAASPCLASDGS